MEQFVIDHETTIRLGFFLGVFVSIAGWEIFAPRRRLMVSKSQRWFNNITLVILNTLLLRLLFPAAAVGMALTSTHQQWGLFNNIDWPGAVEVVVAVILLDLAIYLQHVMVHAIPLLWRLHRVHHTDLDYDVTTGTRFHPLEIILSMGIKFLAIVLLGPSVLAVIIFEILLNATSMFNHGNVRLPSALDRVLRWFIVTPDMHRVHHSVEDDETNSNFGFNLSWWDRLFGTYRAQPRAGHEYMTIGIKTFDTAAECIYIIGLLRQPLIVRPGQYAINRRSWDTPPDD